MHTSTNLLTTVNRRTHAASKASASALCTGLFAFCCLSAQAADKYETYGALSLFGKNQWDSSCFPAGTLASVRLAMKDSPFFTPQNLSVVEGATSLRYGFEVGPGEDRFSAAAPVSPFAMEVWRTYPSIGAGTWDFVSLQKLSNGERLSDAIRWSSDRVANPCLPHRLSSAEVLAGDMQVSTVGSPFAVSEIRVQIKTTDANPAPRTSVALASEVVADERVDTGIDGPKTALLADANGIANFLVTPGTKAGIKRFIVKARSTSQRGSVSAMVTLAHAPAGAPVVNSVPIVEYRYDGGSGAPSRYLTSNAAVTRQLDSRDEANIFSRTGQVWRAFSEIDAAPGLAPVCQFFGRLTSAATVTHFFTANRQECESLRAVWGDSGSLGPGLKYEGVAFYAVAPDAQQRCPSPFPIVIARYFARAPSPHHYYLVINPLTQLPTFAPTANAVADGVAFCTDVATPN